MSMHVVIWTSHGHRYATPSSALVEVIPIVQSRPIPGSEPWLVGLFDYRGKLLPLVDSSRLIGHDASDVRMSSRILVISVENEKAETPEHVGLLVEHVLGAEPIEFGEEIDRPPVPTSGIEFLGPVALTAAGTVQLTDPTLLKMAIQQF